MNYFPNIDKIKNISELIQNDSSKAKIEYLIFLYLIEDYKCFNNSEDYWATSSLISNNLISKDFLKSIKRQTPNYIYSLIDQLIVSILLKRSTETPKIKIPFNTADPNLSEDEIFRI